MTKVFLGGTCANTTWRSELTTILSDSMISLYNPIVPEWTSADRTIEDIQKLKCGIHLYVLTSSMKGVYSVAEAVQSSHQIGVSTYVHIETEGFDPQQLYSLQATSDLLKMNGAYVTFDGGMPEVAKVLKNIA